MVPSEPGALELRFRETEPADVPPDVEAFARVTERSTAAALSSHREHVGVLPAREPLRAEGTLNVFFRYASYGIPAFSAGNDEPLDLSSWTIRPVLFGYLASVPRARNGASRSRGSWIVAACLPLALMSEAVAAPQPDKPSVQRPKKKSEVPEPPGAASEPEPAPGPEPSVEGDPELGPEPSLGPAESEPEPDHEAVTPEPAPEPPAPRSSASGPDPALVDAAWEGVDGFDVVLKLKGGREVRGRVGAVQRDTFTLIQRDTGVVLVLPKSGVLSLRVDVPDPVPEKTGMGLIVGGSIMTSLGAPVFLSGLVMLGICPSCYYVHLPLLLIGGGVLSAGIPMIVKGARRRRAYNKALREHEVSPIVCRTPQGWTGGLRFRF